nr:hypothetical protein [Tanacetum cinerariifolium]
MESSSDSDQEIDANMVFMAQIEKVLLDSEASSSSVDENIFKVSYYLSESESKYEFETSEYYDNSTNYGLFVNNDDDQEIFHDAIESASENFIENHIDSQKDYDKSDVDHNDSEEKDHLVDKSGEVDVVAAAADKGGCRCGEEVDVAWMWMVAVVVVTTGRWWCCCGVGCHGDESEDGVGGSVVAWRRWWPTAAGRNTTAPNFIHYARTITEWLSVNQSIQIMTSKLPSPMGIKAMLKGVSKGLRCNLIAARYGPTRPVECMDYLLWSDIKTMVEPHVEDEFWSTAMAKTINGEVQLHDQVDGKEIVIIESSVRRDLQLADEEGIDYLPNYTIFEQLALMGLGKGFSGKVTPLFQTMVIQNQSKLGEGSAMPTDSYHTPTILQPSSSQPQKTQNLRSLKERTLRCEEKMRDTTVQTRVLDLKQIKTNQRNENDSLKRRVKKLERRSRSRTHKVKRLYKVGLSARVESSSDEESLGEDVSKQERRINAIDADENITLVNDADNEMFDVDDLGGDELFVAGQNENVVKEVVNAAQVSTVITTITITTKEITLAQALKALKTSKPKVKRIVFQEPCKSTTTTIISSQQSQDKALEQEELSDTENATLFLQLLEKRRKYFVAKRAEEKRNKPPIKSQERKIMCTYLKNIEGYKLKDLKLKEFDRIQEMFDRAFRRVNTFEDFKTELVKGKEKKAGEELILESTKKQNVEDNKKKAQLKQLIEIIPDEEEVAIDAIPLAVKSSRIVDWKIHKEGKKSYYQIIYMLVEKKYPFTPPTLSMMLEKKLQINYESQAMLMIKLRADVELKDTIVMDECPKNIGLNVAKNLKNLLQAPRGVLVSPKVGFKPVKQVCRLVSKKNNVNTSGNKKKDLESRKYVTNPNLFDVLNSVENDVDLVSLVDDEGKPLKMVDYRCDHDSEDEVKPIDNEIDGFLASERVGFGTNSLLKQWRDTCENVDYDYGPFVDDIYEGQEILDNLQSICDKLDIKLRGRKKK